MKKYKMFRFLSTRSNSAGVSVTTLKNILVRLVAIAALLVAQQAMADHEGGDSWRQTSWNKDHVIVFSECGYTGLSKTIPVGDYPRMGEIGVRPNEISSIIIPEGLAIEVFQNRRFNGHWYRINQNQICLKGNWNDRIGSMRVVADNTRNSYGFSKDYGAAQGPVKNCHPFTVYAGGSNGGIRFVDEENVVSVVREGQKLEGDVCKKGRVRIELAKRDRGGDVLLELAGNRYQFEPWSQYDDFNNKWYRRYFSVDLPQVKRKQDQMVYGANGWGNTPGFGKRYSSGVESGANWGNNYQKNWTRKVAAANAGSKNQSGGTASSAANRNCTAYTVSGNHKDVGVRFFVGDNKFHLTGRGKTRLQLCHSGNIRFELAKKKEAGEVAVQIGNRVFQFRAGDQGDRYANNWYRKYFRVNVK